MSVLILTVVVSFLLGGGLWLALGSRLSFRDDPRENDKMNVVVYFAAMLPLSFVLVFFGIVALEAYAS
ncbi:hypothetical protein OAO27_00985 [bacterium]|jgi:hypothetical protein|nr:hypothetical protein [Gammaproteobacteria bacterium]MCH1550328.1 hypothetical protein [Pseudomonadales bacterium]MDC0559365.1 hypothetical protein [bacterium]